MGLEWDPNGTGKRDSNETRMRLKWDSSWTRSRMGTQNGIEKDSKGT